jgi:hypothetical protein
VMAVLSEATEGWDAVETELREAAGKAVAQLDHVTVGTQLVVDAVVGLLQSGRFKPLRRQAGEGLEAGSGSPAQQQHHQQLSKDLAVAMDFVGDMLAVGRVTVAPAFVLQLLQHEVQQARGLEGAAREARESAFVKMVQNVGVLEEGEAPGPGPAKFTAQVSCALL